MAYELDLRQFFRRAPHDWLKRYFEHIGVLQDLDWSPITVRRIDPLFDAWNELDDGIKVRTGEDFSNMTSLGSAVGKAAIIDEAQFHPPSDSVASSLARLNDPLACAFWTYLEKQELWDGALFFSAADNMSKKHWRKRANLPKLGRKPTDVDGRKLEAEISILFMAKEARGAHCRVHQYRRGDREYYFAYPQNHPTMSSEYDDKGEWTRRKFSPAFEIVFIHDDQDQSLTIWHQGSRERVQDLQVAFANAVLGQSISPDSPRDERVYDLEPLGEPRFSFAPSPELGIASVEIRKLRIRILGEQNHTIRVDLGAHTPGHVLHDRMQAVISGIDASRIKIASVGLRVTFEPAPGEKRPTSRSFELTWPNSCSLRNDEYGDRIRRMLAAHRIEPRRPLDGDEVAGKS